MRAAASVAAGTGVRAAAKAMARTACWTALALALGGCAGIWPGARKGAAPARPEAAAALASAQAGAPSTAVAVWLTTGDRAKLLAREPDLVLARAAGASPLSPPSPFAAGVDSAAARPAPPAIDIDTGTRLQRMVGFGAALSDASAWLIRQRLDDAAREALLQELFGRAPGLGLSFTRIGIGGADFARSHYSYSDVPAGQGDPGLTNFSIDADREAVLPVLQAALAFNPALEIVASPSSAPGWMKDSDSLLGGALKPDAYDAYARYLKRYVDVYLEEGVPIYALTVQNEPQAGASDSPAMRMDAAARAKFIGQHLGPLLEDDGPRILEWDGNWDQPEAPLKVLADPAAAKYTAGVAWHCYGGDVGAQSAVRAAHPRQEVYVTECSGGGWAPAWRDNLMHFTRTLIVGATRNWAGGVLLGNLALDEQGGPHVGGCRDCRGVVTIRGDGTLLRNPEYYALAHASRFVQPGAHRLASSAPDKGLHSVAFVNPDQSLALIVVNAGQQASAFKVRAGEQGFSATLPAASVATYAWRPSPGGAKP